MNRLWWKCMINKAGSQRLCSFYSSLRSLALGEARWHDNEVIQVALWRTPNGEELRAPNSHKNWMSLEVDPPAPFKPSDDYSPSQHLEQLWTTQLSWWIPDPQTGKVFVAFKSPSFGVICNRAFFVSLCASKIPSGIIEELSLTFLGSWVIWQWILSDIVCLKSLYVTFILQDLFTEYKIVG